ncbi:MAG: NAD-dependent epimerase/dehydratase family protein, partial [Candidatus Helarchaeales archaeon]
MKTLITGVNGFIGSNLAKALLESGHEVRGLILPGTDESFLDGLDVKKVYGDLTKPDTLKGITDDVEAVFHLAARVAEWGPEKAFRILNYE